MRNEYSFDVIVGTSYTSGVEREIMTQPRPQQVIDSFEAPDFAFSGVVLRNLDDGSIESQCKRHSNGCIQTIGHTDEQQAKDFIRWWTTRP